MTAASPTLETLRHRILSPPNGRPRRQWGRAWQALRRLLNDPQTTANALEVIRALDAHDAERGLCALLTHPEGRRLFLARPSLAHALSDRRALTRLPEGSLGRAYLAHIERWNLDPTALVDLDAHARAEEARDPGLRWYSERMRLQHDLQHVVTGLGADIYGETVLLPFSQAQTGSLGLAFLMIGAALRTWRTQGPRWPLVLWSAWRAGGQSVRFHLIPWEELLPLPLTDVRALVGVTPLGPY